MTQIRTLRLWLRHVCCLPSVASKDRRKTTSRKKLAHPIPVWHFTYTNMLTLEPQVSVVAYILNKVTKSKVFMCILDNRTRSNMMLHPATLWVHTVRACKQKASHVAITPNMYMYYSGTSLLATSLWQLKHNKWRGVHISGTLLHIITI